VHTRPILRVQRVSPGVGLSHLHGQADHLRQQQAQQHQYVPIADEKRFHDGERGTSEKVKE